MITIDKPVRDEVYKLIHDYKNEILKDGDWWHCLDNHYLNVYCPDEDSFTQPDAIYRVNLYELDRGDTSSYSQDVQFDLPTMTRKEIRLL